MKFLIVVALVCIAASQVQSELTAEQKQKLQDFYKKCVSESKVQESLILQSRKKNFSEDKNLKEYYHCMFKNLKFQNEDGTLNTDQILAKIPVEDKKELEGVIKDCAETAKGGNTPMEISYLAIKCYIQNSKQEISFN